MTKKFIVLIFLFSFKLSFSQFYGGEKNDKGISFCQVNKNFFLIGTTRSFGSGSEDFLILKINSELKSVWQKEWGGPHHDLVNQITKTSDNNYVIVGSSWDAPGGRTNTVLSKYDHLGNKLWLKYFGEKEDDPASSIIETHEGGLLIVGTNRARGKLGSPFLIKTDSHGNQEWERFYTIKNKSIGMDVIQPNDSTLFLLINTSSFGGKIANSSEYLSKTPSEGMLIKTDQKGNEIWRKLYPGKKHSFMNKIIYDGKKYFYIIGSTLNYTKGSFDISLHKIDAEGNTIWHNTYGGKKYDYGNSIDINSKGELLLTGTSNSFSKNENPDVYVVKIDGGSDSDYGNCGQFVNDSNITILGSSKSKRNVDLDVYFIKVDSSGNVLKSLQQKN